MSILINTLLAINLIVALLIILVTLMQRPKQEGLGAAFGGGMTDNLFGAQTTNVLATVTRWLGGLFFVLTMLISTLYARNSKAKSNIEKHLLSLPEPSASPAVTAKASPSPAAASPAPAAPAPAESAAPAASATPAVPATSEASPATATPAVEASKTAETPSASPAPATPKP